MSLENGTLKVRKKVPAVLMGLREGLSFKDACVKAGYAVNSVPGVLQNIRATLEEAGIAWQGNPAYPYLNEKGVRGGKVEVPLEAFAIG